MYRYSNIRQRFLSKVEAFQYTHWTTGAGQGNSHSRILCYSVYLQQRSYVLFFQIRTVLHYTLYPSLCSSSLASISLASLLYLSLLFLFLPPSLFLDTLSIPSSLPQPPCLLHFTLFTSSSPSSPFLYSYPRYPPSPLLPSLLTAVYVGFVLPRYSVNEDIKDALVCVQLSMAAVPIVDPIWLTIDSEDGTAISNIAK